MTYECKSCKGSFPANDYHNTSERCVTCHNKQIADGAQFAARCKNIGIITAKVGASAFGVSESCYGKWCRGERPIPEYGYIIIDLREMLRGGEHDISMHGV